MIRIGPTTFDDLLRWYGAALDRPDIARFLSMQTFLDWPTQEAFASDYNRVGFLSPSRATFLRVTIDRAFDDHAIGLWSLASGPQRKHEAGRMMMFLKNTVLPTYGARSISASVHGTNQQSLRLMARVFGSPWGIEPRGAWDRGIGAFVDVHCFKRFIKDLS